MSETKMHPPTSRPVLLAACLALVSCFPLPGPAMAQLAKPAQLKSPLPAPPLEPAQSGEAPAQRGASPGKRQKVFFLYHVNPDCTSAGQALPHLQTQPAHGAVEFTPMDDFPNFPSSNVRAKCNGQRFPGIGMFYTSNPAFRGTDEFTLVFVTPEGFRRVSPFQIMVE